MAKTSQAAPAQGAEFPAFPKLVKALEATLKLDGVSQRGLGRKAGMSDGNIRRALTQGSGISNDSWLKLAAASPEGSALRKLLAGHDLPALATVAHDIEERDGVIYVPFNRLRENPDNYRKTFDEAAIEELAASILAKGLLQNLVVFPADASGIHTVNSGSRRFRAVALLVSRQQIPADYLLPVLPKDMSEAEGRALAIVENLQRVDVSPLEEADGFRALRDLGWATEQIAQSVGLAQRTVQDRLQLSEGLFAPVREALAEKRITLDQARAIVTAPTEKLQGEMLEWATRDWQPMSAEGLREHLRRSLIPLNAAAFDLKLYKGPYVGEGKNRLFVDGEQFIALQRAAGEAMAEELGKVWSKATLLKQGDTYQYWNHVEEKNPAKGEAILWLDRATSELKIIEGVAPKPSRAEAGSDGDERDHEAEQAAKAQRAADRQRLLAQIRDSYVAAPANVLRNAILSALCDWELQFLCFGNLSCDSRGIEAVRAALVMPDLLPPREGDAADAAEGFDRSGIEDIATAEIVWHRLLALSDSDVMRLFAELATSCLDDEWDYEGATPVDSMMLAPLGIAIPETLIEPVYEAEQDEEDAEPDEDGDDEFAGTDEEEAA